MFANEDRENREKEKETQSNDKRAKPEKDNTS